MSKVGIALASFTLGVLVACCWFLSQSVLAQAPPSQTPTPAPQSPLSVPNISGGIGVPTVPPITQHFVNFGLSFPGMPFGVDGTECVRCEFNGQAFFRYGGGNFQFVDFKFSGPVRVELIGAARNTVLFLQFVQALEAGQAPKPTAPTAQIIRAATVKDTVTGSFGTSE